MNIYISITPLNYLLRIIFTFCLLCSLREETFSQNKDKPFDFGRRVLISFSYGAQMSGASMQMSDAMVDAKLDDDVRIGPSHYTYPSMEKMFGAYNAEISFRINKQTDISIEGGLLDRFTVKGASNKDDGVRLFLENKVHHLKLQFLYHATQKSTFQIGPSLTFISTEDQRHQAFNYLAKTSKVLPGASVGYKFDLIDTPVFFVSFLVNGNYVFSTEMGPFYAHGSFVFPDFDDPVKYNPSAINFSSATIMLGAGIKIF